LMKAVRKFQVQAASIMLQQGANHLIVSNEGINLLIAATQSGRMEMVKAVYELGGFNVSDVDNRGWNALMHSAQKGDPESVNFLLSCGADPSYRSPNLNITALDLATGVRRKAYKETPEMVSTYDKIIELLSREKVA
ncbi:MAG: ankyrin repeat domain-containing protein, partial [Bdellovibrionales bacterium]|nr:ankyrin repeat domain-containing protein [Bdellovibrionales bacterium]